VKELLLEHRHRDWQAVLLTHQVPLDCISFLHIFLLASESLVHGGCGLANLELDGFVSDFQQQQLAVELDTRVAAFRQQAADQTHHVFH
jgi:hypothetical protein